MGQSLAVEVILWTHDPDKEHVWLGLPRCRFCNKLRVQESPSPHDVPATVRIESSLMAGFVNILEVGGRLIPRATRAGNAYHCSSSCRPLEVP